MNLMGGECFLKIPSDDWGGFMQNQTPCLAPPGVFFGRGAAGSMKGCAPGAGSTSVRSRLPNRGVLQIAQPRLASQCLFHSFLWLLHQEMSDCAWLGAQCQSPICSVMQVCCPRSLRGRGSGRGGCRLREAFPASLLHQPQLCSKPELK